MGQGLREGDWPQRSNGAAAHSLPSLRRKRRQGGEWAPYNPKIRNVGTSRKQGLSSTLEILTLLTRGNAATDATNVRADANAAMFHWEAHSRPTARVATVRASADTCGTREERSWEGTHLRRGRRRGTKREHQLRRDSAIRATGRWSDTG